MKMIEDDESQTVKGEYAVEAGDGVNDNDKVERQRWDVTTMNAGE